VNYSYLHSCEYQISLTAYQQSHWWWLLIQSMILAIFLYDMQKNEGLLIHKTKRDFIESVAVFTLQSPIEFFIPSYFFEKNFIWHDDDYEYFSLCLSAHLLCVLWMRWERKKNGHRSSESEDCLMIRNMTIMSKLFS
jgi:hypothetical protein